MSIKMKKNDPAFFLLEDKFISVPTVYDKHCFICNDTEFAQMGLPLCYACFICGEHVPADNPICINGHEQPTDPDEEKFLLEKYKETK